ncbi:MAG: hypothetical protein CME33_01760 [Gimesia sp.]|nr:hypothetical protein [Gimesia sp.]
MWFDTDTLFYGQDGPDYDLVCPSCGGRCVGKTYARGVHGTYRNPYIGFCVKRILCSQCGIVDELKSGASLEHRFWYRICIGDNVLWAENENRLRQIRDVLRGNEDRNQAALYALPQWLIKGSNRSKAIVKIEQMLADRSLRGTANG